MTPSKLKTPLTQDPSKSPSFPVSKNPLIKPTIKSKVFELNELFSPQPSFKIKEFFDKLYSPVQNSDKTISAFDYFCPEPSLFSSNTEAMNLLILKFIEILLKGDNRSDYDFLTPSTQKKILDFKQTLLNSKSASQKMWDKACQLLTAIYIEYTSAPGSIIYVHGGHGSVGFFNRNKIHFSFQNREQFNTLISDSQIRQVNQNNPLKNMTFSVPKNQGLNHTSTLSAEETASVFFSKTITEKNELEKLKQELTNYSWESQDSSLTSWVSHQIKHIVFVVKTFFWGQSSHRIDKVSDIFPVFVSAIPGEGATGMPAGHGSKDHKFNVSTLTTQEDMSKGPKTILAQRSSKTSHTTIPLNGYATGNTAISIASEILYDYLDKTGKELFKGIITVNSGTGEARSAIFTAQTFTVAFLDIVNLSVSNDKEEKELLEKRLNGLKKHCEESKKEEIEKAISQINNEKNHIQKIKIIVGLFFPELMVNLEGYKDEYTIQNIAEKIKPLISTNNTPKNTAKNKETIKEILYLFIKQMNKKRPQIDVSSGDLDKAAELINTYYDKENVICKAIIEDPVVKLLQSTSFKALMALAENKKNTSGAKNFPESITNKTERDQALAYLFQQRQSSFDDEKNFAAFLTNIEKLKKYTDGLEIGQNQSETDDLLKQTLIYLAIDIKEITIGHLKNEFDEENKTLVKKDELLLKEHNYLLGKLYENSLGETQNLKKAFKHYKAAADTGHAEAQFRLAEFYEKGIGGSCKSKPLSIRYYNKAAANGHAEAQFRSAQYYEGLKIIGQDENIYNDYQQAAKQGHIEALEALERLTKNLSDDEEIKNRENFRKYYKGVDKTALANIKDSEGLTAWGAYKVGEARSLNNPDIAAIRLLQEAAAKGIVEAKIKLLELYHKELYHKSKNGLDKEKFGLKKSQIKSYYKEVLKNKYPPLAEAIGKFLLEKYNTKVKKGKSLNLIDQYKKIYKCFLISKNDGVLAKIEENLKKDGLFIEYMREKYNYTKQKQLTRAKIKIANQGLENEIPSETNVSLGQDKRAVYVKPHVIGFENDDNQKIINKLSIPVLPGMPTKKDFERVYEERFNIMINYAIKNGNTHLVIPESAIKQFAETDEQRKKIVLIAQKVIQQRSLDMRKFNLVCYLLDEERLLNKKAQPNTFGTIENSHCRILYGFNRDDFLEEAVKEDQQWTVLGGWVETTEEPPEEFVTPIKMRERN